MSYSCSDICIDVKTFLRLQTKVASAYNRLCCLATDDELLQAQSASCMCHFRVAKTKGLLTSSGLPSMLGYQVWLCCLHMLCQYFGVIPTILYFFDLFSLFCICGSCDACDTATALQSIPCFSFKLLLLSRILSRAGKQVYGLHAHRWVMTLQLCASLP